MIMPILQVVFLAPIPLRHPSIRKPANPQAYASPTPLKPARARSILLKPQSSPSCPCSLLLVSLCYVAPWPYVALISSVASIVLLIFLHSSARDRPQCGCLVAADALLSACLVHSAFVGILCSGWVIWYVAELDPFYLILILCLSTHVLGPLLRSPDQAEYTFVLAPFLDLMGSRHSFAARACNVNA